MIGLAIGSPAKALAAAPSERTAISAEIVDARTLRQLRRDWLDLLARCDQPNAFLDPTLILAGADIGEAARCRVALARRTGQGRDELVGFWAFAPGRPRRSALPVRVLNAPPHAYGYLATPLLDRHHATAALDAMLDAIAAEPALPKIIALDMMAAGPALAALEDVLAERRSRPCRLELRRRPMLATAGADASYLEKSLSASTRKKLRQHRRRLSEKHALTYAAVSDRAGVSAAVDEFLAIEAAGWKGRAGTALLCRAEDAAFVRQAMADLADLGGAAVHWLRADGRPIAVQLVLRSGPAAYTWKTAYDEAYADFSPGMLLLEDYTATFIADPTISFVDSCSFDEAGMMSAWTGRQEVADLWFDARRGGSLAFDLLSRAQLAYRAGRAGAKQLLSRWRDRSSR